jgi:hypothetical protein
MSRGLITGHIPTWAPSEPGGTLLNHPGLAARPLWLESVRPSQVNVSEEEVNRSNHLVIEGVLPDGGRWQFY